MDKIIVEKGDQNKIEELNISSWPIWTKEVSVFNWHYDNIEECLILEGEVDVGSSLLINGEVLLVGESGKFVKQVFLQPGINTFIFEVKKRYGKVNLVTRDIYFETETLQQPLNQTEGDSQNDNVKVKINNIIR